MQLLSAFAALSVVLIVGCSSVARKSGELGLAHERASHAFARHAGPAQAAPVDSNRELQALLAGLGGGGQDLNNGEFMRLMTAAFEGSAKKAPAAGK